jgi:hypothetical protein
MPADIEKIHDDILIMQTDYKNFVANNKVKDDNVIKSLESITTLIKENNLNQLKMICEKIEPLTKKLEIHENTLHEHDKLIASSIGNKGAIGVSTLIAFGVEILRGLKLIP